jgi:putative ABC transport system permease protein
MTGTSTLIQALRLVRRELRTGLRGFGVFLACLFLGVFAISGIGSFTQAARTGLLADASGLLGGDLEVRLNHRPLDDDQLAFLQERGEVSQVLEMRTMAGDVSDETRILVELKTVDSLYPLYGKVDIEPPQPLVKGLSNNGALVEAAFLDRVGIEVGDQIKIGATLFDVRGRLTAEPDRSVRPFNLGPRVMISESGLQATGLNQPGSLVNYAYRLKLQDKSTVDQLKLELQQTFPEAGWRLRSWRDATPRVRFFLERMNLNLTLLGLCALLVGGLGVSGAVRGYLTEKIMHIATMKSLGASSRIIFTAYLLQVLILGAIGSAAGLFAGAALPYLIDGLIGQQLLIPLQPALYPATLATAAAYGLLIALVFSLKPLGSALRVSPSILFRGYTDADQRQPTRRIWLAIGLTAAILCAFTLFSSSDKKLAFWFIIGAAVCFGIFRLVAALAIRVARKLPRPTNPSLRLGLGNIHRRGSPAIGTLFSLGLGLTTLVIITQVQGSLNDLVDNTLPTDAPSFFFLDIQSDQVAAFENSLHEIPAVRRIERSPTLRGRITAINGTPTDKAQIAPNVQWAVRGSRFLSYAAKPPAETELTAGEWWPEDYRGEPLISLTDDLGKGFQVTLGDTITVNVLGRKVTAKIANLRKVDWTTMQLNFALLLSPGVLEGAPQTHIAAVHVDQDNELKVFQTITGQFPNISAISTREVLANVARTMNRIGLAFKGMAAVALLAGFLVLAGAVSADQHRRIHDAVIFKVCGATRSDIIKVFATEFALLGLTAGAISSLVGSVAAFGILEGLMEIEFSLKPWAILTTIALGVLLTMILGLAGTWKALGQKPAPYLRVE